jgi:hypothetical protein
MHRHLLLLWVEGKARSGGGHRAGAYEEGEFRTEADRQLGTDEQQRLSSTEQFAKSTVYTRLAAIQGQPPESVSRPRTLCAACVAEW